MDSEHHINVEEDHDQTVKTPEHIMDSAEHVKLPRTSITCENVSLPLASLHSGKASVIHLL